MTKKRPKKAPKRKRPVQLPDRPSDLIELALRDLEACEQDPRYEINMSRWHYPTDGEPVEEPVDICLVCLAGSVMAKSLRMPPTKCLAAWDAGDQSGKLLALDRFREGRIDEGLKDLGMARGREGMADAEVPTYAVDRDGFFAAMRSIAKTLRSMGL